MAAKRKLQENQDPIETQDAPDAAMLDDAEIAETEASVVEPQDTAEADAEIAARAERMIRASNSLPPLAHDINVRFAKASAFDGKADDFRLSAALQLVEAEKVCEDVGIDFKEWATANIQQSWRNTIQPMLRIGRSPDPKQAMLDLRQGVAARNAKLRERQRLEREQAQQAPNPFAPALAAAPPTEDMRPLSGPQSVAGGMFVAAAGERAMQIVEMMPVEERQRVVEATLRIMPPEQVRGVIETQMADLDFGGVLTLRQMETGFNHLPEHDKFGFLQWAAEQVGIHLEIVE